MYVCALQFTTVWKCSVREVNDYNGTLGQEDITIGATGELISFHPEIKF